MKPAKLIQIDFINILNKKPEKPTKILNVKIFYFALLLFAVASSTFFGQSITWERTHLYSPIIRGESVKQTGDGNYIICGSRDSYGFIAKLNLYGDTIWVRNYPVLEMNSIIESSDGNYVAVGYALDLYVVKISPSGNTIWARLLTEPGYDVHPIHLNMTNDGNFISAGYLEVNNPTFLSAYYVKFDNNGNKLWSKFIGPQTGNKVFIHSKQLNDKGYILTGSTYSGNKTQLFLVRAAPNGDTVWAKEYGNPNLFEFGRVVFQTNSLGYLIIGSVTYPNNKVNLYFLNTDSLGNFLWSKTYGDLNSYYDVFNGDCVVRNNFLNSYIIAGTNFNYPSFDTGKVFILNIDSLGNRIWEKKFKKDTLDLLGWSIDNCNDSGYVVTGVASTHSESAKSGTPSFLYTLKVNKFGDLEPIGINIYTSNVPKEFKLLQNYPNPFNPTTNIKYEIPNDANVSIRIYDLLGREVFSVNEYKQAGSYEMMFDGSNLASGLYFYSLEASPSTGSGRGYFETKKMVLIK